MELHLDKKDLWRYPLERALLRPLLKDGAQTVHYEKDAKIWKLNGVALQLKNKRTYSKIAGFILYVFHKIRMCFSVVYRKKFQAAKLKIQNALKEPISQPKPKFVLTKELYQQLAPLFSALEDDTRSNDFRDSKEYWFSKIEEVLGKEQLEERIELLRPIFRQREPKTKIKLPLVLP